MALTQGLYTLADGQLKGLNLFQNQADFNAVFFGGEPYVFDKAELQLTPANGNIWRYKMFISDTIGSEYTFDFAQDPHIVFYPVPVDTTDAKDKPYADEQKQKAAITVVLDTLVWDSKSVAIDGVLAISHSWTKTHGHMLYGSSSMEISNSATPPRINLSSPAHALPISAQLSTSPTSELMSLPQ